MADWRHLTLEAIGAPASRTNLLALRYWEMSEGVADYCMNPLAASDTAPGSYVYARAPIVQCYPSLEVMAAVYRMKLTSDLYRAVGDALRADAGLFAIWRSVNRSPWCSGCQAGRYPLVLYQAATQQVAEPPVVEAPPGGAQVVPQNPHVPFVPVVPTEAPGAYHTSLYDGWDRFVASLGRVWPRQMRRVAAARKNLKRAVRY